MADYTPISDSQVDPDAPITSELGYSFRDNPIAIAEGAPGAPRITRTALLNLASGGGSTITTGSFNLTVPGGGALQQATVFSVSCFLPGSVSVFTNLSTLTGGGPGGIRVTRVRNGATSTIATYSTTGNRSDVVNVQVGDKVFAIASAGESQTVSGTAGLTLGNDSAGVVVL